MSTGSKIEWTETVPLRTRSTAASRIGVTLQEYDQRRMAGEKWCGSCRSWHPRTAFGSDSSRGDGLASKCLDSFVVAKGRPGARARRQMVAQGLAWCRGCESWLPAGEVRDGVCRPHAAAEYRAAYAKNPGPIRSQKRARARGLDPIPTWWRVDKFADFGGLCAYGCGRAATSLDHVWPVVRRGRSAPTNLVPACASCNSSKNASDPEPWIDRGVAAFPCQWFDLLDLNYAVGGPLEMEAMQ